MSWIVVLCALQAPADAVEPQDPDRPTYSLADLKALREANVFAPHRSKSTSRSTYAPREDRRPKVEAPPARAKGLRAATVVLQHAFRNAMLPVLTLAGLQFGRLLGGAVVAEAVFARPGVGRLVIDAILFKDYLLVQGVVLFIALTYAIINLAVDLLYLWIDPRIRYT